MVFLVVLVGMNAGIGDVLVSGTAVLTLWVGVSAQGPCCVPTMCAQHMSMIMSHLKRSAPIRIDSYSMRNAAHGLLAMCDPHSCSRPACSEMQKYLLPTP